MSYIFSLKWFVISNSLLFGFASSYWHILNVITNSWMTLVCLCYKEKKVFSLLHVPFNHLCVLTFTCHKLNAQFHWISTANQKKMWLWRGFKNNMWYVLNQFWKKMNAYKGVWLLYREGSDDCVCNNKITVRVKFSL